MHRFFYKNLKNTPAGSVVSLDKEEAAHLFRILRAREGDRIGLLDGEGRSADAAVLKNQELRIEKTEEVPCPAKRIHLYLAPPRKQKMDQLLKQAAELGVWSITPVLCERSVSIPDGANVLRHWTELLQEACKQSGNVFLPQITMPVKFADAVKSANELCTEVFFGDPAESGCRRELSGDIGLFVGPEGGFSPAEDAVLHENNFSPLRIGSWILRVETAAVAGIAVLTAGA